MPSFLKTRFRFTCCKYGESGASLVGAFSPGCWFEFQALGRSAGVPHAAFPGAERICNLVIHAVNNLFAFIVTSFLIMVKCETE